jgi:lysine-N-methylase
VTAATPRLRARYSESFQCIGSACEDNCCTGFTLPVDQATWEKYQSLPPSPLQILLQASVSRAPERTASDASPAGIAPPYATLGTNSANQCLLLTEDRLCCIQAGLGENFLSHTCATYPRIVHAVDGMKEAALTLSCPEAVRHVLLNLNLMGRVGRSERQAKGGIAPAHLAGFKVEVNSPASPTASAQPATSSANSATASPLPAHFWEIREVVLNLLGRRTYPIWQRLFLLGVLCRRLDSISSGEIERDIPEFLMGFESTVASGNLRAAMETLPTDHTAQMDAVLRLAGLMLHKSNVRPRFAESIHAFTEGIGNGPTATLESLTAHYTRAHDRFYAPFIALHPHVMENYLVNTIVRCQFPFGREGMKAGSQPDMSREFALLTAQFALMRGLLIGVAGFHGSAFSVADVVKTVQAATKHFEHHPEFPRMAHELLVELRLDGTNGLATLLRNVEADRGAGAARPAVPATPLPATPDERSAWAPAPAGKARPV